MESRYLDLRGLRLHVAEFGRQGRPLIMLHSTGFGHWMWKPMLSALLPRFHVFAPDQRGHGDSDKTEDGYDFATLAGDMEQLFEALDLSDLDGVGHSSGATTLLSHAALYPGRIRRLLLVEPVLPRGRPDAGAGGANPMAERARHRRAAFVSVAAMYESFRGRPPFDTWREDVLRLYCEEGTYPTEGGVALKCPPEYEARFYEAVGKYEVVDQFREVRIPVRTLWGERTNIWPPAHGPSAAPPVPGDQKVVAGATHFLPMEKPEVVVAEALAFFGEDGD